MRLVETYFRARDMVTHIKELSPELQMFKVLFDSVAKTELEQKRQSEKLTAMDQ